MLDEAGNIAPLRDLPGYASTARSHGISLVTVWQDLAHNEWVACMRGGDFIDLVLQSPQVARGLLEHLVQRVRELTDRVFELSTLGVQNRIDAELLRLAKIAGVTRNAARVDPAPLHADVASQVSTNREQVTREISQLVKLGILVREGKALVVPDVARLERLVAEVRRTA